MNARTSLRPVRRLPNDEWCYPDCDGFTKHGQHVKMQGSCGYVNFRLIDSLMAGVFRKKMKPPADKSESLQK